MPRGTPSPLSAPPGVLRLAPLSLLAARTVPSPRTPAPHRPTLQALSRLNLRPPSKSSGCTRPLSARSDGVGAAERLFRVWVAFSPVGPVPPPWSSALAIPGELRVLDPPESSQGLPTPFRPKSHSRACGCARESVRHTEITSHFPSIPTYWRLPAAATFPGFWKLLNNTSL